MRGLPSIDAGAVITALLLGEAVVVLLVAVTLFFFHRSYRRRHLLHWAWSWTALLLYLGTVLVGSRVAFVGTPTHPLRLSLSFLAFAAGYLQIVLLLLGTWELATGREASRRLVSLAIGVGVAPGIFTALTVALGPDPGGHGFSRLGLRSVTACVAYLAAAAWILRSGGRRHAGLGRRFMVGALVVYSLDQAVYTSLSLGGGRGFATSLLGAGVLDIATQAVLGLAVVVWLLEDERERVVRAVDETARRQKAQACVYRISEAAHSVGDLAGLFRSIHASVSEILPARNFYIALLDRATGEISFPYFVDEHDQAPAPRPLRRGLTEYVLRSGRPLLATPDVFRELVGRGEVELVLTDSVDWVGAPLLAGAEAIGVVAIQSYDPGVRLGPEELEILVYVSEQVASAIEARSAGDALRDSEARLRQVIDLVPHFIFAKDEEGRFILVNRAVAEAYGTTVEELLGKTDADFNPSAEEVKRFREDDLQVIRGGRPRVVGEESITDASGRVRFLQTTKIPFAFHGSGRRAVLGVSLDITERKATEEALRRAAKEESLAVLAGGVAHDFNNLLAAILGHTSLALAKLEPDSPARRHVEKAGRTVERAAALTRQMLAYSGRGHFRVEPTDLNALVRENLPLLEVALPKSVQAETDLGPEVPFIDADVGQLQQVVMNLVLNAGEAIGDRGGRVTIVTRGRDVGPGDGAFWRITGRPLEPGLYALLEVRDDGPGMDGPTLERVFDPFFSTKLPGRGLGLPAVLGVVRGHRAGLSVESAPGKGTAFQLLFAASLRTPAAPGPPSDAPQLRGARILVIDDEDVVREMVREVLEHEGFEVVLAESGSRGLDLLRGREDGVDLVLLDLSMPGWDGEETLRRLRAVRSDIRVILSSGYDYAEASQRFSEPGPAGFIQKPYRPDELLAEIGRCLGLRAG
jgi:PAS domain S-box-containing protein